MFKNIKECMASHIKLVPNKDYAEKIDNFIFYWINKRPENIDSITTNLVGVYKIVFTAQDTKEFFDLIGVENPNALHNDILSVKGVEPFMQNATKPSYQVVFYCIHLFLNSNLKQQEIERAVTSLYKVFGYQSFGSMYSHFFHSHTPSIDIAKATLNRMTFKYLLKKLGSWDNILIHKATDFFKGNKLYAQTLRYSTEDSIKVINEAQSKLKDLFKNNYQILRDTINSAERIKTTRLVSEIGEDDKEGEVMGDVGSKVEYMTNYLNKIITDKNNFIKENIVDLITLSIKNLTSEDLKNGLTELLKTEHEKLYDYIYNILMTVVNYLKSKNLYLNYKKSLHTTTTTIINYFKSISSNTDELKPIKNDLLNIYTKYFNKKNISPQSMTVAVMSYIVMRGLLI